MSTHGDGDEETTNVALPGASPSESAGADAATGSTPATTPPPPAGDGEENKVTVGRAIAMGVKDAGAPVYKFLDVIGGHLIMVGRAFAWLPRRPFRGRTYLEAMEYIGFGSLPIILLVGAFTGAVMSLQSVNAFRQFGLESFAGGTTGKAIALELGPVLTSLMLAGRAGAGIATELGTMRITEQIDALESMAVNPHQYLILPRIVAAALVAPVLALLFFVIGMGGAYISAVLILHVDQGQWIANLRDIVEIQDVVQGFIKAIVFGFMVALVGCYQGYHATGGGRGVGIGTTRAVVIASVATLVLDYFMSDILWTLMPPTRMQ